MIHDFATTQRWDPTISCDERPKRRLKIRYLIYLGLLPLALIIWASTQSSPVEAEFSPGLAEAKEYQEAFSEGGVHSSVDEKQKFEEAVLSNDRISGYVFYESLPSKDWEVPIQEGVYYTEDERKRNNYSYILQAASIKSEHDALDLVRKLKALGLPASYSASVSHGGVWYRVNVGPFKNNSVLNKAKDVLVSMEMMPLKRRVQ